MRIWDETFGPKSSISSSKAGLKAQSQRLILLQVVMFSIHLAPTRRKENPLCKKRKTIQKKKKKQIKAKHSFTDSLSELEHGDRFQRIQIELWTPRPRRRCQIPNLSLSLSLLNIAKNFNYCKKKKKKKNQYFDFLIILADIDFSDSFKFQLLWAWIW